MNQQPRCDTCRFARKWLPIGKDDPWERLACHRNPPVVIDGMYPNGIESSINGDCEVQTEQLTGRWPLVMRDEWCGEWQIANS